MLRNSITVSLILGGIAFACSAGSPSPGSNVNPGSSTGTAGSFGVAGSLGGPAGGPGVGGSLGVGGDFSSGGTGNAATCDGKFVGQLYDFTVRPTAAGSPPGYMVSPDFEPADNVLHPGTTKIQSTAYKQGTNVGTTTPLSPTMYEAGIVAATLGMDQTPTYAKAADGSNSDSTTGAANFLTWYHATPNVNLGESLSLQFEPDPLNPSDPDAYVYDSTAQDTDQSTCPIPLVYGKCPGFFPVDNQLLGNENNPHNYHMTFQMHLRFVYQAGQQFTFSGDDDVWVFVNNQLAVDLGGIHQELTEDANLTGLQDGMEYPLDFFWAERHVTAANFRIATSLHVTNCGTIK